MFRVWQYALKRLHAGGAGTAEDYLRDSIHSHFKKNAHNERRLEELVDALYRYSVAFKDTGHVAVEVLKRINVAIDPRLEVTGEVTRIDIVPAGGYAGVLLSRESEEPWRDQIRFPLLQGHIASLFGCSPDDVSVGVYSLVDGAHDLHCFPVSRVSAAMREMTRLAGKLP